MGIFDVFRDTIFLKEDSNLEKQIEELKSLRDKIKDKDKIDKDIKLLELGLQGEKEIAFELKNANIGMYVVHDVTIPFEDLKAQIDYVIVTKGFTYLIECKNLIGNVTVDKDGQFRREYNYNGRWIREGIYSPYTQAQRHKELLKKRWISKNNKIKIALLEKSFDNMWYKSLVVLSNSKSLLNTRFAPSDVKKCTIRVDQLIDYIKKDIANYDTASFNSKKEMEEIAQSFVDISISDESSIVEKYRKEVENNQSTVSKKENNSKAPVCPWCKKPLIKRRGKYGDFYGCPSFPNCRYVLKIK